MAKYSKGAQKGVESAMKRMEKGTLRSGKSTKKVTNPKQAIAIGLSEAKKKGAKVPAKKTATKKTATKKAAPKKAAKKKTAPKKSAAPKKKAAVATRKPVAKKAAPKKAATKKAVAPRATDNNKKQVAATPVPETIETNLPPVEEKSPEVNTGITSGLSGLNRKDLQKAAVSHYDNHHIRLSNVRKGGIKPSGKKPLW